jgi:FkbM family methyltransferase
LRGRVGHLARGVLQSRGRAVVRRPRALIERPDACLTIGFEHLLALRMLSGADLFFVQVGAFDGRTGDQLHEWIARYHWRGILVEPQPRYFAELQRTYADRPDLVLKNAAIGETRGTRTLYTIRDDVEGLPWWAPQVASFDRAYVESKQLRDPAGGDVIESVAVPCVPFEDLLSGIERLDLLQIDTEGYDAAILAMFDFDAYRPQIVRFEHVHLSASDHDSSIERLADYGYRVAVGGKDTIAWHGTTAALDGPGA